MDDLITEFLAETNESLGELDNALVLLEQNPHDDALISKIFRFIHTIKGTCGFLGLSRLEKVAHKGEDVLGLFRDKKLAVTPAYISLILEAIDRIKDILLGLENTGSEPQGDDSALIGRLEAVYQGQMGDGNNDLQDPFATPAAPEPATSLDGNPVIEAAIPVVTASSHDHDDKSVSASAKDSSKETAKESALANQSLRVSVDVLENLMTMVSELVLTRNQLMQTARQYKDGDIHNRLQRLNHVVSELQDGVMKTRMQPVGNAWSKLPRIVRDTSAELGKKIDLEMYGQDTELDRQVLDMIKDPLTHMVRNSVDHGIETPAKRLEAGKPETGKITLNSYHQGGHIIIEIADDGKGLPLERIRQKAVDNKLVTPEQMAAMSVQQIQQFIFHPGLSTAEKITAVSGRGVGMDVVRSNIQKIGGTIELKSVEGHGTTFIIKIPLTLAIVSSLIIGVGDERFAIPQLAISELVMVNHDKQNQIEYINDTPVYRLRNKILPLIELGQLLHVPSTATKVASYIIVLHVADFEFGLIVDHVYDMEEIVIKPVSDNFKTLQVFSGNTILGDGHVIMILDVAGLLNASGINKDAADLSNQSVKPDDSAEDAGVEQLLLLFKAGDQALKAIELDRVSRLEEIDVETIEFANGNKVIQYLGKLMPVYQYDDAVMMTSTRCPLIILQQADQSVGLIADQILDIATYCGDIRKAGHKVLDSIIINDQATDVVNPEWFTIHGVRL